MIHKSSSRKAVKAAKDNEKGDLKDRPISNFSLLNYKLLQKGFPVTGQTCKIKKGDLKDRPISNFSLLNYKLLQKGFPSRA